jgi:putative oxidoreductase
MQIDNWICYIVGFIFITSGMMKLLEADLVNFFNLGLPSPTTIAFLVAITEIGCGSLIIAKLYVKQATIPLLVIMAGAVYLTKFPILINQGILVFAFQSRLDIAVIILLLILLQHVRGKRI